MVLGAITLHGFVAEIKVVIMRIEQYGLITSYWTVVTFLANAESDQDVVQQVSLGCI